MTDQPLPLKPLNLKGECLVGLEVPLLMQWCDVHEKPYYACKIYELETKLAAKEAEIAMLKNSMHYRDKTHPWAKIQELEAETIKILTEALEKYAGIAVWSIFYADDALDRVRGGK